MKTTEMNNVLEKAMRDFSDAYVRLRMTIERYEQTKCTSVNDLPGFTASYPFDKSFDELPIEQWVDAVAEGMKRVNYTVLNYEYLNTGGNTMVGIFEVWLPEELKTVYVYANEEGCTMSLVDYIRNELTIDDYDELVVDYADYGRMTGYEKYFELYRHCLNTYFASDCKYFGTTIDIPYHLLSDELQQQITDDYKRWIEANERDLYTTDGRKIIVCPDYEVATVDEMLKAIKEFKNWHDTIAGREEYYDDTYKLEFAGRTIELPFMADVWDAVDTMLKNTIDSW